MKRTISLACRLAALLLAAQAAAAGAQTLSSAVREALERNPEVGAAAANVRAAEAQVAQARSGYFPTLDVTASGGKEQIDNPGLRAQGLGNRSLSRDDVTVTARQMLFDGFSTSQKTTQQEWRLDAAKARLGEAVEDVAGRTVEAYLEVLRSMQLLDLARTNEQAHTLTLEKTQQRLQQKVGSQADVHQSQARLAVARSQVVQREGSVRDAEARFVRLLGHVPRSPQSPASRPPLPATEAQAVEEAINGNPTVKAALSDVDAATAGIDAARAAYMPRLDLELTGAKRHNTDGINGGSSEGSALVVFRYNAFRGGADQAVVREQTERRETAREGLENARRAVGEAAVRAWVALESARSALPYLTQHVSSTAEVLLAYRAQFELGRRTLLDLLNAENELFQARSNLATGDYAILLAEYRLLQVMGGLAPHFDAK
jgi:outer membrane protein, adhesin transport system